MGPNSVALYVSGQMLTEDYYVANKLMKGFVGSANIDTNSRLCMASSVAGHKRAFGADVVPNVYEDIEEADLVVLVGSNLAWCHPVLFQRMERAKAARPNMRVVNIDPRRTATSEIADLQLSLKPGADVALFLGLLRHLERAGRRDVAYVERHTNGVDDALLAAEGWSPANVAAATGLDEETSGAILRSVRRDRANGHHLFPGRQPVLGGNRQGQRHTQLPSSHRPRRPARRGSLLGHGAAERHGRP